MAQRSPAYRRILLKLSGEALLGSQNYGIDPAIIRRVAIEVTEVVGLGVQVGLVIGGGNIFRGAGLAEAGMDRVTADQMGMLATVINSLAMQDALERQGTGVRVMDATAIVMCRENNLPLVVFNLNTPGDLVRVVTGEPVGTSVMNHLPRTGTGK